MTMKASTRVLIGVLIAAPTGFALARGTADMKGMSMAPAAKHGHASGVIKAVNPSAGTVTIRHGPIAGLGWPAMTMTFKATPLALLHGLKVGEAIDFDASATGMAAEVTAVRPR
jgi:Cu(I)/Ag(I) efflux system protein CusF